MMSKVGFVEDAKLQYVSCPLKVVVDLSSTQMDRVGEPPDSAVQPAPTATIAGSAGLAGNQFFDVTALIQEVTDVQEHNNNRSSFVVNIYDGSLDLATQKVKVMPLRIYFDTTESVLNGLAPETKGSPGSTDASNAGQPVSGERMKALADEHLQSKTAMSFFCISGAQDDTGKFVFRSTKHTFITGAVGTKAEKMNGTAELHNLQADDTVVFELQTFDTQASRDWSLEPGRETQCGLLASFARTATGVPELDDGETVWQCNWVRMTEPSEGQDIKNQFNKLWLQLTSRDTSGPVVLYITEKAVVKLTNVVDAAEFEQLHAEGRLRMPFFASIKVYRRPSKSSAVQPGANNYGGNIVTQPQQNDNSFDCYIVDAAEQDMQLLPSTRSIQVLPLLLHSADSVLPATLAMIRKSDHYSMAVEYVTQQVPPSLSQVASKAEPGAKMLRPCSRAVALVLSTKRSKVSNTAAGGYKLVTDDVVDCLQTDSTGVPLKYELTCFCTLDNVTDFKLDPPKGAKAQAALISVTGVIGVITDSAEQPVKGLLIDDVHLLSLEDANALKPMLTKMLYFAALSGQISRKREREPWSPTENPGQASACRALGRSPTGPALPDYSPSP